MQGRVRAWVASILLRGRLEREMREEMTAHVERATERLEARGMSRTEAERAALREFGRVDQLEEEARDARGSRWLETTAADVRFAFRQFRRMPSATLTMVLVLALGIGANTGVFTVLHSMSTMPPPGVPRDDALVRIQAVNRHSMSYPEVMAYAAEDRVFSDVIGWTASHRLSLDVRGQETGLIPAAVTYVTRGYFDVLGVQPLLGSASALDEESQLSTVPAVISHEMWRGRFGGSRDVIGRTIRLNERVVTIAGVAPPRFIGVNRFAVPNMWLPLSARAIVEPGAGGLAHSDSTFFTAAARLQPGVSAAEAQSAVRVVAARAVEQMTRYSERIDRVPSAQIAPLLPDNEEASEYRDRQKLLEAAILGGIALLVLLITCTNVSGLLVGAGLARRREIAVRLSLGAGRRRLIRQLLTESVILSFAAAALGLVILGVLIRAFGAYVPDVQLAIAWQVLAFTGGVALLTGIIFGASPALHATRLSVSEVLKDAAPGVSHSRFSLQRGLIIGQIALTQPLLVGLGVAIVTLVAGMNYRAASPFADRIATFNLTSAGLESGTREEQEAERARRDAEFERIRAHLEAQPGVVAAIPHLSFGIGMGSHHRIHPADRVPGAWDDEPFRLSGELAAPGYLALMGIPLVAGRDFDRLDPERDSSAALIGTDLARRLFGVADPIGRRLIGDDSTRNVFVAGVFDAGAAGGSDTGSGYRVFRSNTVMGRYGSSIRVRTSRPVAAMIPELRAAIVSVAPNRPIADVSTLASDLADRRREMLIGSGAAGAGGLLALFLSAIGLYALVSLAVTQRTREIGIRTALGAERGDVIALFFAGALRLAAIGLALGLPLSLIALRLLRFQLDSPQVRLSLIGLAIAFGVVAVAALASWIPARRAAAVDPLRALRESLAAEAH